MPVRAQAQNPYLPGGLPCFSLFRDDGAALQMATVTGSVSEGFVATLTVGVAG